MQRYAIFLIPPNVCYINLHFLIIFSQKHYSHHAFRLALTCPPTGIGMPCTAVLTRAESAPPRHVGRSDLQNGPFCTAIRPISHCKTAHFKSQNGPFYNTLCINILHNRIQNSPSRGRLPPTPLPHRLTCRTHCQTAPCPIGRQPTHSQTAACVPPGISPHTVTL